MTPEDVEDLLSLNELLATAEQTLDEALIDVEAFDQELPGDKRDLAEAMLQALYDQVRALRQLIRPETDAAMADQIRLDAEIDNEFPPSTE